MNPAESEIRYKRMLVVKKLSLTQLEHNRRLRSQEVTSDKFDEIYNSLFHCHLRIYIYLQACRKYIHLCAPIQDFLPYFFVLNVQFIEAISSWSIHASKITTPQVHRQLSYRACIFTVMWFPTEPSVLYGRRLHVVNIDISKLKTRSYENKWIGRSSSNKISSKMIPSY